QFGQAGRAFAAAEASADSAAAYLHGLIEQVIRDRAAGDADWAAARRAAESGPLAPRADFEDRSRSERTTLAGELPGETAAAWDRLRRAAVGAAPAPQAVRYAA